MRCKVIRMSYITRSFVKAHPDHIFLFGDNLAGKGFGGQAAAMRGEPNAVGIPTKKYPSNSSEAFFCDSEIEQNREAIDLAFDRLSALISSGMKFVVIPADGLGTGRAQLQERAPLTFAYLQKRLRELSLI